MSFTLGANGGQTLTWFQGTLMVYPWPWPKPMVDQLEAFRWGPEPTLLIAMDGKIEHTGGRENKRLGHWGAVEESIPQIPPNHSYQFSSTIHSFSLFSPLNLEFIHSLILAFYVPVTSPTHLFHLLLELLPQQMLLPP